MAPAGELPEMLEEARAFFAIEGVEAMSAFLRNGDSVDSRRLKARGEGGRDYAGEALESRYVARERSDGWRTRRHLRR